MGGDPFGTGTQHTPSAPARRPGASEPKRRGGPAGPGGAGNQALDELAPVPDRPRLYPVGSRYYRVRITFEVEILDPVARGMAQEAAS